MTTPLHKLRCAVYTRKSTEEGLEMAFNSLDAQREACEAYIVSQRSEGWTLAPTRYDDGGFSGGTIERPALKRLLADIEAGRVDVVVVYKIDRLTRSLTDFSKLVEVFDRRGVTFVSVTQSFNTTTSMGRLTLNMLLSFAQFEREVIGERIRDKFAASRKRGIWMGGHPPLGYDAKGRRLVVNEAEATLVRHIFTRFARLGSTTRLAEELNRDGHRTKARRSRNGRPYGARPFDTITLYNILKNRVYLGEAVYKGTPYPGEHEPIVTPALWDKANGIMGTNPRVRANRTRAKTPALLKGLLYGPRGEVMVPTHTRKGPRLYRYYFSIDVLKRGADAGPVTRVPAGEIEGMVMSQVHALLRSPEIVVRTWRKVREQGENVTERDVSAALEQLDTVWGELLPAEQTRIVQLLVERVDIADAALRIRLRAEGLVSIVGELRQTTPPTTSRAA